MFNKEIYNKLVNNRYGSKWLGLKDLWFVLLLGVIFAIYKYGITSSQDVKIIKYIIWYVGIFSISVGIFLTVAVIYSNGPKSKRWEQALTYLLRILFFLISIIQLPITFILKGKEALEVVTYFKIDEPKFFINLYGIHMVVLIFLIYLIILANLWTCIESGFINIYLLTLTFGVIILLTFGCFMSCMYKLSIRFEKSVIFKREILYNYYQYSKEKSVVMYIVLIGTIIVVYSGQNQDIISIAATSAVTTIILFDTLIERWKSKLFKSTIEFKIAESLSYDIQLMPYKLDMWEITNSGMRAKLNADLSLMRELSRSSRNKNFKDVVEKYADLTGSAWNYKDFNKRLYNLEEAVFKYMIKAN